MQSPSIRARFSLAGASVIGPAHARAGRNNQDAWAAWVGDDLAVLAVADGCSGGVASEVGAHLAARWIVAQAARRAALHRGSSHEDLARDLFDGLTEQIRALGDALAPLPDQVADVVADLFLTTVIVALVDAERASVIGIGDGLVVIDGAPIALASDPQKGPLYLGYRLCDLRDTGHDPGSIAPRLVASAETGSLRSLVIGTDGAHDLLPEKAGADEIAAIFADPRIARRPALLGARLEEAAARPGLVHDDVTLAALIARDPPSGSLARWARPPGGSSVRSRSSRRRSSARCRR